MRYEYRSLLVSVAALAATTKSAGAVEAARPSVPAVPQTAGDTHAPSALFHGQQNFVAAP